MHGPKLACLGALLPLTAASAQVSGAAELWGTQGASCATPPASGAKPWKNPAYAPECRARYALRQFRTLDEKFRYLDPTSSPSGVTAAQAQPGDKARDVAVVLDLPSVSGSDGPAGLAGTRGGTAFPTPLSIAATFDPAAAARYGDLIGAEFQAAGLGSMLGPALDIARSWRFGRLTESFGEDPFLVAEIAAAEIKAIQARQVITTMKHYAAYTQDAGRVGDSPTGGRPAVNVMVSERALREIYLPGFEAAVRVGGAGGVMCSFPRINGVYACENAHLFDILKREWGFDGLVMPDFPSAQRSITRAFLAGLDGGSMRPNNPRNAGIAGEKRLYDAVKDGEVPEARIDDLIMRRLIPALRIGQMDKPPQKAADEVSTPATRAAAAVLVAEGSVLLKNDLAILPLGPNVRKIAVIGTQGTDQAVVVEQGSPWVKPVHLEPALPAIRSRAGTAAVSFAPGTLGLSPLPAPPAALFRTRAGESGFTADYFANPKLDFSAAPLASRTEVRPYIDKAPTVAGLPENNQWSVRYTATFTPAAGGVHKFSLHGSGSARLWVNGKLQGQFADADFGNAAWANVALQRGRTVEVRIDYSPRVALGFERRRLFGMNMGLTLEFGYAPPDNLIAEAAATAKAADVAIIFAGEQVGEGMDRSSLSLQNDQDALIEAVAKANPSTVVVLTTGGPVAMPWRDRVAAVVEMWLPGDAFGPAAASLLFGDREPGGRLPVTFPASETEGPAQKPWQFPGVRDPRTGELDTAYFDEGLLVGYRWWDARREKPLFPFGHGLGYARFAIADQNVERDTAGGVIVHARLRNVSGRAGSEVVQIYLAFPQAAGEPPRQLKGFRKVSLAPGQEQNVEIRLAPEAFLYWDEGRSLWQRAAGPYQVMVGTSSRNLPWHAAIP